MGRYISNATKTTGLTPMTLPAGPLGTYEEDATNFDGLPIKEQPDSSTFMCPKCKGHGRWNHQLNVFAGYMDVKHPHATYNCYECNGRGWKWDIHEHTWVHVVEISNCYNQWKCSICGKLDNVDSGD